MPEGIPFFSDIESTGQAGSLSIVDNIFNNGEDSYSQTAILRGLQAGSGVALSLVQSGLNSEGNPEYVISISIGGGGSGTVYSVNATGTSPITVSGGPITTEGTFTIGILPATDSQNGYLLSTDKIKLDATSGTNTGDQTITLIGDVTGSASPAADTIINTTLVNSGVTPGTYTYTTLTVDATGRIIAASNGTNPIDEATTAANIGTGFGLFATKVGTVLQFKSLTSDGNITIAQFSDHLELLINASNLATTLSPYFPPPSIMGENLGSTGASVYQGMSGNFLTFNRIQAATSDVIVAAGSPYITVGLSANIPRLNQANLFTGQLTTPAQTLLGPTISWNLNLGNVGMVTLTGNSSLLNPTNMEPGGIYYLIIIQDTVGSRTLNYDTAFRWPNGYVPVLSTGANAIDCLHFVCTGSLLLGTFIRNFI